MAVVFTRTSGRLGHLQGGEAMMRLMLEAELLGLATCPLSQAVDLLEFRARLQAVMGWPDYPQMMLRLGVAPVGEAARTPRRPVADVLRVHDSVRRRVAHTAAGGADRRRPAGRRPIDYARFGPPRPALDPGHDDIVDEWGNPRA